MVRKSGCEVREGVGMGEFYVCISLGKSVRRRGLEQEERTKNRGQGGHKKYLRVHAVI